MTTGARPTEAARPASQPQPRPLATAGSSALVIQTSFLGDVVLTTPLLDELAARGPVDVMTTPGGAALLANHPAVRDIIVYDKRGGDRGFGGIWRMVHRLRDSEPRVAYLAQGSVRSAMVALLAGCRERVGFAGAAGRRLYTRTVIRRDDRHHAERLWRLAFADQSNLNPTESALRPRLYPSADDRAEAERLTLPFHGERFIALAPGSIWGTKRWPYYPELAATLARQWPIALVGSGDDAELASTIAAGARSANPRAQVVDATGRTALLASAELIGRAALLVTNDSLPQHLASAMGTPTLTLFGPTVPAFGFGPLAPGSVTLGLDVLPCRPCHHHGPRSCPLGHWRCMRELTVKQVSAAAEHIMSEEHRTDA